MMRARKGSKDEASTINDRAEQAKQLDQKIRVAVKTMNHSLTELGKLLVMMKQSELWRNLPERYRGWEDYAQTIIGSRARSTLYEILAAHSLTGGVHAIQSRLVNQMGIKRAAQIARLKPIQRTPAVIEIAVNGSLSKVKAVVQEVLNQDLPEEDRRETTVLFSRNLPAATANLMEEIELDGQFMEGIRDGDSSVSLRGKFWHYVCVHFREKVRSPLGRKGHSALTVTVGDLDGLVRALSDKKP